MSAPPVPTSSTVIGAWPGASASRATSLSAPPAQPAIDPGQIAQVPDEGIRVVEWAVEQFLDAGSSVHPGRLHPAPGSQRPDAAVAGGNPPVAWPRDRRGRRGPGRPARRTGRQRVRGARRRTVQRRPSDRPTRGPGRVPRSDVDRPVRADPPRRLTQRRGRGGPHRPDRRALDAGRRRARCRGIGDATASTRRGPRRPASPRTRCRRARRAGSRPRRDARPGAGATRRRRRGHGRGGSRRRRS